MFSWVRSTDYLEINIADNGVAKEFWYTIKKYNHRERMRLYNGDWGVILLIQLHINGKMGHTYSLPTKFYNQYLVKHTDYLNTYSISVSQLIHWHKRIVGNGSHTWHYMYTLKYYITVRNEIIAWNLMELHCIKDWIVIQHSIQWLYVQSSLSLMVNCFH